MSISSAGWLHCNIAPSMMKCPTCRSAPYSKKRVEKPYHFAIELTHSKAPRCNTVWYLCTFCAPKKFTPMTKISQLRNHSLTHAMNNIVCSEVIVDEEDNCLLPSIAPSEPVGKENIVYFLQADSYYDYFIWERKGLGIQSLMARSFFDNTSVSSFICIDDDFFI